MAPVPTLPIIFNSSESWRAKLPRFDSLVELCKERAWLYYLVAVYGTKTRLKPPIDLQSFHYFYVNYLPVRPPRVPLLSTDLVMPLNGTHGAIAAAHRAITNTHLQVGRKHLDVYAMWSACDHGLFSGCGRANLWIYPFLQPAINRSVSSRNESAFELRGARSPLDGIDDHTRVEVHHCSNGRDGNAYWMYFAPGSGVYFDVGVSLRFLGSDSAKHTTLLSAVFNRSFSKRLRLPDHMRIMTQTFIELHRRGYDSVQFPSTFEHRMNKFEIVDLRPFTNLSNGFMAGTKACPMRETGAAAHFYHGWQGTWPCVCQEEAHACLNCGSHGPDPGALPNDVVELPSATSAEHQYRAWCATQSHAD